METCLLTVLLNNGVLEIGVARLDVEVDISSLRLLLPLILKGQVTAIVGKHLVPGLSEKSLFQRHSYLWLEMPFYTILGKQQHCVLLTSLRHLAQM